MARKTKRIPPALSIYLGKPDVAEKRIAILDRLADQFSDGNRSRLIAMIADGELFIVRPERSR